MTLVKILMMFLPNKGTTSVWRSLAQHLRAHSSDKKRLSSCQKTTPPVPVSRLRPGIVPLGSKFSVNLSQSVFASALITLLSLFLRHRSAVYVSHSAAPAARSTWRGASPENGRPLGDPKAVSQRLSPAPAASQFFFCSGLHVSLCVCWIFLAVSSPATTAERR